MRITLRLDGQLVKEIRKIAVDRETTLTSMIREYLQRVADESAPHGRRRCEREALERSFEKYRFKIGNRTWERADLHGRHS